MQAKGNHKMNLRLDKTSSKDSNSKDNDSKDSDSKDSYTSRKAYSMQRKFSSLRSMHIAKNVALLRQLERNNKYSLCELVSSYLNLVKSVQCEM